MPLRLFNSMTREKEDFVPLKPGKVGIYVCGVTVYDLCHVGHARCYIVFDTVVRWLRRDHQVTFVRNFTDVDDKIIKRANERGEDPIALSARFADEFHADMHALGVADADIEPRVSTHIEEIVALTKDLVAKEYAYVIPRGESGDVYYRVKKFGDRYLQLSGRSFDDMRAGERVAVDERKEDPADFALWKSAKPGEPSWDSPWGKGRPGWHIECSAMSLKHLGVTFDIHGGGKDLVFPHHTNEIAQSEAAHEHAVMARFWLHNGFVEFDGEKIAKSDPRFKDHADFFVIRNVLTKFTAEALRMLMLGTHYRGPISFSPALVEDAEKRVQSLYETRRRIGEHVTKNPSEDGPNLEQTFGKSKPFTPWKDFVEGMEDDFNTPKAIAALIEITTVGNALAQGKEKDVIGQKLKPGHRTLLLLETTRVLDQMCAVLGVGQKDPRTFLTEQRALRAKVRGIDVTHIDDLLRKRATAKAAKDYAASDAAREELTKLGVEVRDTPDGAEWTIA